MSEKTRSALLSAAGVLRLLHEGMPAAAIEIDEITTQIGEALNEPESFTWADVDFLRAIVGVPLSPPQGALADIADRIASLLPPREP